MSSLSQGFRTLGAWWSFHYLCYPRAHQGGESGQLQVWIPSSWCRGSLHDLRLTALDTLQVSGLRGASRGDANTFFELCSPAAPGPYGSSSSYKTYVPSLGYPHIRL